MPKPLGGGVPVNTPPNGGGSGSGQGASGGGQAQAQRPPAQPSGSRPRPQLPAWLATFWALLCRWVPQIGGRAWAGLLAGLQFCWAQLCVFGRYLKREWRAKWGPKFKKGVLRLVAWPFAEWYRVRILVLSLGWTAMTLVARYQFDTLVLWWSRVGALLVDGQYMLIGLGVVFGFFIYRFSKVNILEKMEVGAIIGKLIGFFAAGVVLAIVVAFALPVLLLMIWSSYEIKFAQERAAKRKKDKDDKAAKSATPGTTP